MGYIPRELLGSFSMDGRLLVQSLPDQLNQSELYELSGQSGEKYVFHASPRNIFVYSETLRDSRLSASVNSQNHLEWRLYTRMRQDTDPNPDLHATKFYHAAMQYLIQMGNRIDVILAIWNGGTNLAEYRSNLRSGMQTENAALNTW